MTGQIRGDVNALRRGIFGLRIDEGINVETLSANKNLDKFSKKNQSLNPNGSDRNIILPDATTLDLGWEVIIRNSGSANFLSIKGFTNTELKIISPIATFNKSKVFSFQLVGNSTTAGSWSIRELSEETNLKNIINVSAENGNYTSIKTAVDSIMDASAMNPYIVLVGPGVYIEDTIMGKSYVSVMGTDKSSVMVQVNDPNKHVFEGVNQFNIKSLTIQGATGVGKAAIHYDSAEAFNSMAVEDVKFGNNYTLIHIENNNFQISAISVKNISIADSCAPTIGIICESNTGLPTLLILESFSGNFLFPIQDLFVSKNPGSIIVLTNVSCLSAAGGRFLNAVNGTNVSLKQVNSEFFDTSIEVPNIGAPSLIRITSAIINSLTNDLLISHPGTSGAFQGLADSAKITINPSATVNLNYTDSAGSEIGSVILGEIKQGDRHDRLVNLSKLIRETSTLGAIENSEGTFISLDTGFNIIIAAGSGFLNDPSEFFIKEIFWDETPLTLSANSTYYVYVDTNSIIQAQSSFPSFESVILLGRVNTNDTTVRFIENSDLPMNHYSNRVEDFLRNTLGPVFQFGAIVTESMSTPRHLDSTAGKYSYGISVLSVGGGEDLVWESFYKDGSGNWISVMGQNTVSNVKWDDGSGILANISSNFYAKHHLYVLGDDGNEKWFLIYAQVQYATLAEALEGPVPTTPSYLSDGITRVVGIVVQQGQTNIVQVLDLRPRIGFAAPSGTAVTDHGSLQGLLDDDHPQYLLVSGSRAMTGPLNMNGQAINNAGLINSVNIATHAARHLPGGGDALTTGNAVAVASSNGPGITNSFSRSDHIHEGLHSLRVATGSQRFGDITFQGTAGAISLADSGTGTFTWDLIPTAITSGSYGSVSQVVSFTVDDDGRLTSATNTSIQITESQVTGLTSDLALKANKSTIIVAGTGLSGGGDLSTDRTVSIANTAVTSGSYGSSSQVATFTVNAQGQLTAAANISITTTAIGAQPLDGDLTAVATLTTTGFITRTATDTMATRIITQSTGIIVTNGNGIAGNPLISLADTAVVSGSYGNAAQVASYDVDAQGRLTNSFNVPIQITESQVTGLVTDLGLKADKVTTITAGTGLTGGGSLAANRTISLANTSVTAGSYGSASQTSTFTVDAQGRLTTASNATITTTAIGAQPLDGDLTAIAGLSTTGIIVRTATDTMTTRNIAQGTGITVTNGDGIAGNPTISLTNTAVTAGSYGSASSVATYSVDAQGRLTASASVSIQITESQVTNLTTDLALKADSSITISPGTGLMGGGDLSANRTLSLTNTGIGAGTYGSASQSAQLTIDSQGRVTAGSNLLISIASTAVTDFTEASQDAVGGALTDSSSIDFTYNDVANTITAVVLPAGVDHNSLLNFVANKHIDHSTVNITAGTGLTGGGDITTTRTLNLANTAVTASSYGSASSVATYTVDAQGRLTASASASIQITESQVTSLITDLGLKADKVTTITAGTGLSGGGDLSANRTLNIANTGVSAGSYGSSTAIPVPTINAQGQITSITTATPGLSSVEVSASVGATTTSTTDVAMTTMTNTPVAGRYLVIFGGEFTSSAAGGNIVISVYAGGTRQAQTERQATPTFASGGLGGTVTLTMALSTQCEVTVNGSQAIEIRWKTSTGTATVAIRNMNLVRLGS